MKKRVFAALLAGMLCLPTVPAFAQTPDHIRIHRGGGLLAYAEKETANTIATELKKALAGAEEYPREEFSAWDDSYINSPSKKGLRLCQLTLLDEDPQEIGIYQGCIHIGNTAYVPTAENDLNDTLWELFDNTPKFLYRLPYHTYDANDTPIANSNRYFVKDESFWEGENSILFFHQALTSKLTKDENGRLWVELDAFVPLAKWEAWVRKELTFSQGKVLLDGKASGLPYRKINGKIYIPVRETANKLGYGVTWDPMLKNVFLNDPMPEPPKVDYGTLFQK